MINVGIKIDWHFFKDVTIHSNYNFLTLTFKSVSPDKIKLKWSIVIFKPVFMSQLTVITMLRNLNKLTPLLKECISWPLVNHNFLLWPSNRPSRFSWLQFRILLTGWDGLDLRHEGRYRWIGFRRFSVFGRHRLRRRRKNSLRVRRNYNQQVIHLLLKFKFNELLLNFERVWNLLFVELNNIIEWTYSSF